MATRILLPVVLAALLLTACGGAGDAITFKLYPHHGSRLHAVATLAPSGGGSELTIDLTRSRRLPRRTTAAVYDGSCATIAGAGALQTVPLTRPQLARPLRAPLRSLTVGEHAVVLERRGVTIACGDVPRS